jgi:hypothetical protein
VIQVGGLYVYNMHNMVEKHLAISIAAMRSRGGSLVNNKEFSLKPTQQEIRDRNYGAKMQYFK